MGIEPSNASLVSLDGSQVGDVAVRDAAGRDVVTTTINQLADVPPGWAEMVEKIVDRLHHTGLQIAVVERQLADYILAESLERERRIRDTDRQHQVEQAILMDGLNGIRDQIADLARVDRAWLWWLIALSAISIAAGALLWWLMTLHLGG